LKHLDQKYFTYRARKVDAASAQYPERSGVLKASEYLRLGFVGIGAFLFALVFGILAMTAGPRVGWFEWRTVTFFVLTALNAAIVLRVAVSFIATMQKYARRNASLL
jgi:hypothetical protein